jgi:hypothetical protein
MAAHERQKSWWTDVASVGFEHFTDEQEAYAAENRAIRSERPLYNGRPPLEEAA